jgi:hypothetical protein
MAEREVKIHAEDEQPAADSTETVSSSSTQKYQPWRDILQPLDTRNTEGSDVRLQLEKDEHGGEGG